MDDQEQIEKLKRWWISNGLSVCLGLGLGVSAVLGWRLWEVRAESRAAVASDLYEDLKEAIAEADSEDSEVADTDADDSEDSEVADTDADDSELADADVEIDAEDPAYSALLSILQDEYPETPYASLAALLAAREEISAGHLANARRHLEWVVDTADNDALLYTARMRLIRVLLALRFLDDAEQQLQADTTVAEESAMHQELWGDLQELRARPAEAIVAYRKAYQLALKTHESYLPFLKIKLEALGVDPEELEALEEAANTEESG